MTKKLHTYSLVTFLLIFSVLTACKEKNSINQPVTSEEEKDTVPVLMTGEGEMPTTWIDKTTGHQLKKLTSEGNNRSFYFHNNPFVKAKNGKDWLMVFYKTTEDGNQLYSLNLNTQEQKAITTKPGKKRGEIVGTKSRKVFYTLNDSVFATHIDTQKTDFIKKLPEGVSVGTNTLNASEELLGGVVATEEEAELFRNNPKKSDYFNLIYEAHLPRYLMTINVETGKLTKLYRENAWLNHEQFSPVDPNLLMYCHEGPWHKVNRIWTYNLATGDTTLIHKRTVHREIAGHEFFSPDGQTIWFDLQIPRGETFYLAGKNIHTGEETRYQLERNEWSIHYNISPDMKTFAGDGGDRSQVAHAEDGQWIYHFTPNGTELDSEKLVDMSKHNYDLEPNVHFSPDGKWIIFRANFEGDTQIYAVKIEKHKA